MARHVVSLSDRYDLSVDRAMLSGSQALVRLTLMQKARDAAEGLNTGGFVTGYRGSPLGALDTHFEQARTLLEPQGILFTPGLNEELAATAIWGAQQIALFGEQACDGVFCLWYGKGPGVDRSGDVFRHANIAGTAAHGGVLVLMGDDHAAESSTVAHQSEFAIMDAMMPILHPAGVQEILDFGILGIAMSRFSGCWVGLKCVHDNVESTAVVDARPERIEIRIPEDFSMPPDGLNIRRPDERLAAEARLHLHKLPAAQAFARTNRIDRVVWDHGARDRIGVIATGKSWLDLQQALLDLGIDETRAADFGLRLMKVGMVWPLDPDTLRRFAEGLETVVVIEEKRAVMEPQVKELLYHLPAGKRPVVVGKRDQTGAPLLPSHGVIDPNMVAEVVGEYLLRIRDDQVQVSSLEAIRARRKRAEELPEGMMRTPWFCAGCPHNTSTRLPEGARGYAGIGCHWLVQLMPDRRTVGHTQMGGEGANWIGEAPFSKRRHVFQNMGDGTYAHSGILAIRACLAAGVNITFKILYNDAVAMTGGQAIDGGITVADIARQVRAEGVDRIAVIAEEPARWARHAFPERVTFHTREELGAVQEEFRRIPGVSVIIYDQTCAAEKRRRRRRGQMPKPTSLVVINEAICEGCGDCGVQSNCVALVPVETRWGRKRQVDQAICNQDQTCLAGACPAMLTVEVPEKRPLSTRRYGSGTIKNPPDVDDPHLPRLERPWALALAGIGGTGVVTVGQIVGHGAHIAGLGAGIIDMSGISQKNGTVVTHIKLAATPEEVPAIRVADGSADVLFGFDILTTASRRVLRMADAARTAAMINTHKVMPGQFAQDPDLDFDVGALLERITSRCRNDGVLAMEATAMASHILGDAIFANMLLLGAAYQRGLVPVSGEALEAAIHLNGVAVDANVAAFRWGRALAFDAALCRRMEHEAGVGSDTVEPDLETILAEGRELLTTWQNGRIADEYERFVRQVATREREVIGGDLLARTVARQLARLTAVKDEYEVARLLSDQRFIDSLTERFGDGIRIRPWLSPPFLNRRDAAGRPVKRPYGGMAMAMLPWLARLKFLRGTPFDIFGYRRERREEMRMAREYRAVIERLMRTLTPATHARALHIARAAARIRGFGDIRRRGFETWLREAAIVTAPSMAEGDADVT